jgi:hypothetical protein
MTIRKGKAFPHGGRHSRCNSLCLFVSSQFDVQLSTGTLQHYTIICTALFGDIIGQV